METRFAIKAPRQNSRRAFSRWTIFADFGFGDNSITSLRKGGGQKGK